MTTVESCFRVIERHLNVDLIAPHQPEGCRWMLSRELDDRLVETIRMPKGGLVADEVGLGKTILAVSMIVGNVKPNTLIILPKSLVLQWKEQIEKFTSFVHVNVLLKSSDTVSWSVNETHPSVHLMSYSLLNRKNSLVGSSEVHNFTWDRIIIDEAHMLRNRKSKLYASTMMLKANIRWALTATPIMNRMSDFVNLLAWIGVSQELCQREKDQICDVFLLRRTKEDVSVDVPKCETQIRYVPFSSTHETHLYCKVYHEEQRRIKTSEAISMANMLEHLLRVRQLCIHPQLFFDGVAAKLQTEKTHWPFQATKVVELMRCLHSIPFEDKSIVFCQFVKEMDLYAERLKQDGYKYCRIDGSMTMADRQTSVELFTNDSSARVFLIQINTGGQGINLQAANHVFIMSPNWNPASEYQAIGRAYRTGQTKTVYVTRFCITSGDAENPFVEEKIIELQARKKKIISTILRDARIENDGIRHSTDMSVGLTKMDILKIFNIYLKSG